MSFNFGQFRKNQVSEYLTALKEKPTEEGEGDFYVTVTETTSLTSAAIIFADKTIDLDNALIATDSKNIQQSYFLKFNILQRSDSKQIITVKLYNTNKVEDNTQTLTQIEVPTGTGYSTFEIIISPNSEYDQVQFILNREGIDYTIGPKLSSPSELDSYYGSVVMINIENFSKIYNIIDFLNSSINNRGRLKQLGIQGPVGLLMNINGESIRMGRTGFYEINNGVLITSLGFIISNDNKDNFIVDYQY